MSFVEIFLIGVGLSMDAFAVAVCKGLDMKKINIKHTFIIALFFGGFQALMPLAGWALGKQFEKYIVEIDHWIAFVLLAFIGGKMIFDTVKELKAPETQTESEEKSKGERLDIKELLMMAVATSIDALAVGISFAFLGVKIWSSVSLIGITTFVLSVAGVFLGNKFGEKYKSKASLAGGVILILIGLKILLEHLEIINF